MWIVRNLAKSTVLRADIMYSMFSTIQPLSSPCAAHGAAPLELRGPVKTETSRCPPVTAPANRKGETFSGQFQQLPPPPSLHTSHRISPHYSGADRWAALCISPMYFLKSEKPIHLGQTHEGEGVEGKLQNSPPPPALASAQVSFTSSLCTLCFFFSLVINCSGVSPPSRHVPWLQPKS